MSHGMQKLQAEQEFLQCRKVLYVKRSCGVLLMA